MKTNYGLSIKNADEKLFASGLFGCFEYCNVDFRIPGACEKTIDDAKKLAELSKEYGVKIRSYHLPFSDEGDMPFIPASLDKNIRKNTFEKTKELINIVAPCGIEIVVIHGSLRVLPEERQQKLDIFVDYIKDLCDFCKPLGIKVAVESLKPRCIGNSSDELIYIVENVNRDNVGICFDSNHLLFEDNTEFVNKAGKYIITTHLSDFDGDDEKHWYPGRGINNWKSIVGAMKEKGYTGPWVFEVSFPNRIATVEECKILIDEWEKLGV